MPSIVNIHQLDFGYGAQPVLHGIDLQLESGRTLGVIGPNGGGKTTLLRMLLGLYLPTRGTISVDGLSPRRAIARGDVMGYLPQHPRVPARFPLSVRQVVRLGLAGKTGMLRHYAKDDLEFVESLMQRVGLRDLAGAPVSQLSGGQLQRVFVARAIAARPKLLLLDEPTTGIDRAGQENFVEFIRELKNEMHLTIVLTSHDPRAIARLADRVAWLNLTMQCADINPGDSHSAEDVVHRMLAGDWEPAAAHHCFVPAS